MGTEDVGLIDNYDGDVAQATTLDVGDNETGLARSFAAGARWCGWMCTACAGGKNTSKMRGW